MIILLITTAAFPSLSIRAGIHTYGQNNTVVGALETYTVKNDESLIEIARKFRLGYNEIVEANPGLDPFIPGNGRDVRIPSARILPDIPPYGGIVINLTEMRLYYFFRQNSLYRVATFPIGIGSEGTSTPVGKFRVIEKIVKPSWHVPESIRRENPELPRVVPAGPDNPLGSHALRLSLGSVLIHGTNRPFGIGRRASHGCIRLYPEDIPTLFKMVNTGTPVTIIRQPVKVGVSNNKVFVEVHRDDSGEKTNYFNEAASLLRKKNLLKHVDTRKLHQAVREKKGFPVEISD